MNQNCNPEGNLYMVPTFGKVGQDQKVRLGDIKPNTDWDDGMDDWMGTIQLGGEEQGCFGYDGEHWYVKYGIDDDGNPLDEGAIADDIIVDINRGLIVVSVWGAQLTFAGEVLKGSSELYTDPSGNAYTGNFTPVAITLGDLVPNSDWDDGMDDWLGTVQLGGEEEFAFGYDGENWYLKYGNGDCYDKDGELIEEGGNANKFELAAGQGLVIVTVWGAQISIPGADE